MTSPPEKCGRRTAPKALASLALVGAMLLLACTASAAVVFKIPGRGYGHGIGMSQWGAYGYAQHGASYRKIVAHYYQHTDLDRIRHERIIKVLLSTHGSEIPFSHAERACGHDLQPSRTYIAQLHGSGVRLERNNGHRVGSCGDRLGAQGKGTIEIGGDGNYRGNLIAKPASGGLNAINAVALDDYVKGVVPNEVPASWPVEALRAQAVAARSYVLATDAGGDGFSAYDDTRSQVYAGYASEQDATNGAVNKTSGEVLTYNGDVIPAFFFSTSGGRTESVEYGFPGAEPKPYLKSVSDPYDDSSPEHKWTVTYSRSEMENRLAGLVEGRLNAIDVTETGDSPRIVKAKIVGSKGKTAVTGETLRGLLGLRSTWARFHKVNR